MQYKFLYCNSIFPNTILYVLGKVPIHIKSIANLQRLQLGTSISTIISDRSLLFIDFICTSVYLCISNSDI